MSETWGMYLFLHVSWVQNDLWNKCLKEKYFILHTHVLKKKKKSILYITTSKLIIKLFQFCCIYFESHSVFYCMYDTLQLLGNWYRQWQEKRMLTLENQPLFPLGCFVIAFHDGKAHEESFGENMWHLRNRQQCNGCAENLSISKLFSSSDHLCCSPPLSLSPSHSFLLFFPFVILSLYFTTMIYVFPSRSPLPSFSLFRLCPFVSPPPLVSRHSCSAEALGLSLHSFSSSSVSQIMSICSSYQTLLQSISWQSRSPSPSLFSQAHMKTPIQTHNYSHQLH